MDRIPRWLEFIDLVAVAFPLNNKSRDYRPIFVIRVEGESSAILVKCTLETRFDGDLKTNDVAGRQYNRVYSLANKSLCSELVGRGFFKDRILFLKSQKQRSNRAIPDWPIFWVLSTKITSLSSVDNSAKLILATLIYVFKFPADGCYYYFNNKRPPKNSIDPSVRVNEISRQPRIF